MSKAQKEVAIYRDVVLSDGTDTPAKIEIREAHGHLAFFVTVTYAMRISPEQKSQEIFEGFMDETGIEIVNNESGGELDEWLAAYRAPQPDDAA